MSLVTDDQATAFSRSGYIVWLSQLATALELSLVCLIIFLFLAKVHKYKFWWFEGIQTCKKTFTS